MKKEHCPHYQLNEEAKAEYESFMASIPQFMREQIEQQPEDEEQGEPNDNYYPECMEFCKFLNSGDGYPGEHITGCICPGHEQIMEITFHLNEII